MANKNDNTLHFGKVRVELSPEACEYLGGITNGVTIWNIYSELLLSGKTQKSIKILPEAP